jgi:hypothetical protein
MTNQCGTYHINCNGLPVEGHFIKCSKCGKKIVIEIVLCGVSHNVGVSAVCAECMKVDADFKKEHPDIAKQIEEFCNG